jgi:glycerophosphoryl diester phosphodiesterase
MNGVVAAFQLWDRIGADARPAVEALSSTDAGVADKAEWMLVQGGPSVLPLVRQALSSGDAAVRKRATRIVAWQGDGEALERLHDMQQSDPEDEDLAKWAIAKIRTIHPGL